MPTTQGEGNPEKVSRSEALAEFLGTTADEVVGPRARPLDVLLVIIIAVSLVVAGASQPVPLALGMGALILLCVRVLR